MTAEPIITSERLDDFPLLLSVMLQLGLPEIFDHHIKRHGSHQGLSWGWIASIWLAHLLTKSNHRKQPVQAWVKQVHATIEKITGQTVRDLDFTDERLTLLLRRLSKPEIWQAIEKELSQNIIRVYDLKAKRVRLDATTVSGYHTGGEESLFQYGYSKDDPTLRQVKAMVAALDPFGLPLVSQVVAGDVADDHLYRPAVDQVLQIIEGSGLLFVGDSKMSALATRAHIHRLEQHYLCPLAQTGETAKEMEAWIEAANSGVQPLQPVYLKNEKGKRVLLAEGYAFERSVRAKMAPREASDAEQEQAIEWTEQVFVVRAETIITSHTDETVFAPTSRSTGQNPPFSTVRSTMNPDVEFENFVLHVHGGNGWRCLETKSQKLPFKKRCLKENRIMNKAMFEENWSKIRGQINARWDLMVEYDLVKVDKADVKFDKFVTMLQVKYGYTRQKAREEIGSLWAEYEANTKNGK